jgi:large subunit ribosomal protein L2
MAIVTRKPRNSSLRFQSFVSSDDITKTTPEKALVKGLRKQGGRNCYGRITMRHQGGGAHRKYRMIDFNRIEKDIVGKVVAVEYDPNRNVRIALIVYQNGVKRYILMPQGLSVGHTVIAGEQVDAKVGNCIPLRNIPVGFNIHNIEMTPGSGGKLARSAGVFAQLVTKDDTYATLKMPSGEIRMVSVNCWATIGELGNADFKNISWGKAGRTRNRGIRPTVRGMAMNPVDHPHGGGEGRSKSGSHPMTPWGKGCKGTRTRTRKNALILKRRKSRKE